MAQPRRTGQRKITRWQLVLVVLCALWPVAHGIYWAIPLTGAAVSGALACWRLVHLAPG